MKQFKRADIFRDIDSVVDNNEDYESLYFGKKNGKKSTTKRERKFSELRSRVDNVNAEIAFKREGLL